MDSTSANTRREITALPDNNIRREFVRYPAGKFRGEIEIHAIPDQTPETSVIIPTFDAYRGGYFPNLLEQIHNQTYQDFEIIVIKKETRQGRAINAGVAIARGQYIIILDDDTELGTHRIFEKLIDTLQTHAHIGMAGVPNLVPDHAPKMVKSVMKQVPRRSSPMVDSISDSDLAEHPCCAIPKDLFVKTGGENEQIPRGLDPYLRAKIREAGYRVVVIPEVYIHHLPPETLRKNIRQFFRNGKMAAYVNKFYPDFVIDLSTRHGEEITEQVSKPFRMIRYISKILIALVTLKWTYLLMLKFYALGFIYGYLTLEKDDV